jgi:membrane fusion protein, multidrug efflux system
MVLRSTKFSLWLLVIAFLLLFACGGASSGSEAAKGGAKGAFGKKGGFGAQPPAPVRIAAATTRSVPVEVTSIGAVEPYATVAVRSQVAGILDAVHFSEGQFVQKGAPLFDIDPRPFEEAIREAEANLNRAKAAQAQAEANWERSRTTVDLANTQKGRIEKLVAEGVFSREQLDNITSDVRSKAAAVDAERASVDSAKANVGSVEAALSRAKLNLTYTKIAAPMSGRTGNLVVKQGNLVRGTEAELVSILQLQPIYVTFSVPESQLPEVRSRMQKSQLQVTATLQGLDQAAVAGRVTFLDNAVDPNSGTIKLKGTFGNANSKLWPGQFVNVKLRLSQLTNATVLPPSALMTGQQGEFVFVVKGDSVEQRPVTVVLRGDGFVAISSGVVPGENVVIDGQVRLIPGSKVKVIS